MDRKKTAELRSWIWVILWTVTIFLTVPVARTIQKAVAGSLGRPFFMYGVMACMVLAAAAAVRYLVRVRKIRNPVQYVCILAITGLFCWLTWSLRKNPEEAVHYVEYGLLAVLVFRALRFRINDITIYFAAAAVVLIVGTGDEFIQWTIPNRTWDFRDVWLNFTAGGLAMLGLWAGIRPAEISCRITRRSYMRTAGIVSSGIILVGLCFINTPAAVYRYSAKLPFLEGWQKNEPMSEFGYRYDDPDAGIFFSRLSPEELKTADENRTAVNAAFLADSLADEKHYGIFLQKHNPFTNPFLYEMRIHLFRRDRHLKAMGDNLKHLWYSVVIDRESKILEKYFGNTYRRSPFYWPPEKLQPFSENAERWRKGYTSLVSYTITTGYSLKTVWLIIALALAGIWSIPFTVLRNRPGCSE